MNPSNLLNKFKKPQFQEGMHPVKYFNENPEVKPFAKLEKTWEYSPAEDAIIIESTGHKILFVQKGKLTFHSPEAYPQTIDEPFDYLNQKVFKGNYRQAIQYIELELLNKQIPYIRVGTDYFKVIEKVNEYGVTLTELKKWNKETIKLDHGQKVLDRVSLFDDFTIEPDNIDYQPVVNGMYNLYQPFPHKPQKETAILGDFPTIASFMAHIFGDQIELGYKYMKVLYEYPRQMLPILSLVSRERQTGKTSVLNMMHIIFANNFVIISPEDLTNNFNSAYAYKNIIGIDETVIEKSSAIERIKSIATARSINVNEKMVAQYQIPFFGKLMLTTNRETDFMKIDNEEIRFWVRKLPTVAEGKRVVDYEKKILTEVPAFLRYLLDNVTIEFGKSRMVFTSEEIANNELAIVKNESKSGLHKELEIMIQDWFSSRANDSFYATPKEIKSEWFDKSSQIGAHYIRKVLQNEIGLTPEKQLRYNPFDYFSHGTKVGTPYLFRRKDWCVNSVENDSTDLNLWQSKF